MSDYECRIKKINTDGEPLLEAAKNQDAETELIFRGLARAKNIRAAQLQGLNVGSVDVETLARLGAALSGGDTHD